MSHEDFAQAATVDVAEIPAIDIRGLLSGEGACDVAEQMHKSATQIGFVYLKGHKGHGIAPELIAQAFAVGRDFFEQPTEAKATIVVNTQHAAGCRGEHPDARRYWHD